jgi:hypothetical protein
MLADFGVACREARFPANFMRHGCLAEQTRLRNTDDLREGVGAMAERRVPVFRNRSPFAERDN